jgi:hypothetical protein
MNLLIDWEGEARKWRECALATLAALLILAAFCAGRLQAPRGAAAADRTIRLVLDIGDGLKKPAAETAGADLLAPLLPEEAGQ